MYINIKIWNILDAKHVESPSAPSRKQSFTSSWHKKHRIKHFPRSQYNASIVYNLVPRKVYDFPDQPIRKPFIEKPPYKEYERNANVSETTSPLNDQRRTGARNSRVRREVTLQMRSRTVETMVVVDRVMYEFHKAESIVEPYVLTIMNVVSGKVTYDVQFHKYFMLFISRRQIICSGLTCNYMKLWRTFVSIKGCVWL